MSADYKCRECGEGPMQNGRGRLFPMEELAHEPQFRASFHSGCWTVWSKRNRVGFWRPVDPDVVQNEPGEARDD